MSRESQTFAHSSSILDDAQTSQNEILDGWYVKQKWIPPRRVGPGRRKIIEDKILKMEKEGTITKSRGPWCSPSFWLERKMAPYVSVWIIANSTMRPTKMHTHYRESIIS